MHTTNPSHLFLAFSNTVIMQISTSLLFLLSSALLHAQTLTPANDSITKVTILSDRAEITRQQRIRCPSTKAGVTASFKNLPAQVQIKTLRAEVTGPAEVIGITHRVQTQKPVIQKKKVAIDEESKARLKWDKKVKKALKRQQVFLAEKQRIQNRQNLLTQEKERLKKAVTDGLHLGQLDFKSLEQGSTRIFKQKSQMRKRLIKIDEEIYKLKLKLYELSQNKPQMSQVGSPTGYSSSKAHGGNAIVSMNCNGRGSLKVELSYVTAGASWEFDYALNIISQNSNKASVSWSVNAIVRQNTGEDWKKAQVYLSTAQPNLGDRSPLPRPLHITGTEYKRQKVLSQRAEDRQDLAGGQVQASSEPVSVAIEDRGQSFGLKVPQRLSVLSDGQPYWIPVSINKSTKAKLALITTPKLSAAVYKVVRFNNPAPHPMPAGSLALSFDGLYLGQVKSKHYGQGEPVEFTLGAEESLRVQRVLKKEKDKKAGLLESDQTLERYFEIKLSNSSKKSQKIEVIDNIPVSEIEDIKVNLDKKRSSKDYQLNSKTGFVSWQVNLKAKEDKSLFLAYTIELPDDWKLQ